MIPRRPNKQRRVIVAVEELPYICNAAEAGLLIRQNPETVQRMARDGILPGRKQGQAWYFRRDDLVRYIDDLFKGA